jgi:hypothetical protein
MLDIGEGQPVASLRSREAVSLGHRGNRDRLSGRSASSPATDRQWPLADRLLRGARRKSGDANRRESASETSRTISRAGNARLNYRVVVASHVVGYRASRHRAGNVAHIAHAAPQASIPNAAHTR